MATVRVNQQEFHVEQRGHGTPLLLVHGFPLDHTMWRSQVSGLSDQFQVIAPDLRGFGASPASSDTVTMEQFADDLAGLLDALQVTAPIAYCGLSMGGYVGWQFWRRHAERLAWLILCDTRAAADSDEAARARLDSAVRVLADGTCESLEGMLPKLFAETTRAENPEIVESTRRVVAGSDPRGVAAALRGMAARAETTDLLPEIGVPTLVLCGQHDAISPVQEMMRIAGAMPDARFVEIPRAGHLAPLENPSAVNAAIREFLPG